MRANRGRDTAPEKTLRSALHKSGLRFRVDVSPEPTFPCKVDIVFRPVRLCVFVDGCFWHGCPKHFACPKTHTAWWREKVADNRDRDRRKTRGLEARGWLVLRFWEHDILRDLDACVRRIGQIVGRRRARCLTR
jgi:DNA mismatch endonuclease (patch repair protein)